MTEQIIFQIGVCKANDDVTEIVKQHPPGLLVLVEPQSLHNDDILSCYDGVDNVHIENVVITDDPDAELAMFYYHKDDGPLYEVASLYPYHLLKHGYNQDGIVQDALPATTVEQLFDKYNCIDIDILFIDAEGFDDRIVRSIDLEKYNIKKIYFENLHLEYDLNTYLHHAGYNITRNVGHQGWSNLAVKQ